MNRVARILIFDSNPFEFSVTDLPSCRRNEMTYRGLHSLAIIASLDPIVQYLVSLRIRFTDLPQDQNG